MITLFRSAQTISLNDLKQVVSRQIMQLPQIVGSIGDPLQIPPPPTTDIAQNTEKNTPKDSTTNSGSTKPPKNGAEFGLGIAETVKEKKSIGGKIFLLKSGVWVDQEYVNSTKTNSLKRFELKKGSQAYQKTLIDNPTLKAYFDLGTSVTVVYKDIVYMVSK